ncbi:unnamed protein product, partial [Ascophyllum nodosum]
QNRRILARAGRTTRRLFRHRSRGVRTSITLSEGCLGFSQTWAAGRSGFLKNFREHGRVGAGKPTEGEASPAKNSGRSDDTGRGSATESACTRASARKDA